MNDDQKKHVDSIAATFEALVKDKYERGAIEHKGNLWEVDIIPLLYNLREEVIDSFVYLQTAIDELEGRKHGKQ